MGHPDSQNGLKTQGLLEELKKVNERLDQQQRERHQANSALQVTIGKFGTEALKGADRIDHLERGMSEVSSDIKKLRESMSPFADLASDLKYRLVGDPDMKTDGLIAEHNTMKDDMAEIKKDVRDTKREQRIAITVLAAAATVIYFLQKSGAIDWLQHKP